MSVIIGIDLGTSTTCCTITDTLTKQKTLVPLSDDWKGNMNDNIDYEKSTIDNIVCKDKNIYLIKSEIIPLWSLKPINVEKYPKNQKDCIFNTYVLSEKRFSLNQYDLKYIIKSNKSVMDTSEAKNKFYYPTKPLEEIKDCCNFSPIQISTSFLKFIYRKANEYIKFLDWVGKIEETHITVPQDWSAIGRNNIIESAKKADLPNIKLIDESVSSALLFLENSNNLKGDKNVLVFDLGGGTLDIGYVTYKSNIIDVQGSVGDKTIGGDKFDLFFAKYVVTKISEIINLEIVYNEESKVFSIKKDMHELEDFTRHIIEKAKSIKEAINSSDDNKASFGYTSFDRRDLWKDFKDYGITIPDDILTEFTLEEFNNSCEPIFEEIKKVLYKLVGSDFIIKLHGKKHFEKRNEILYYVDHILLVGGGTMLKKIPELIKEFFEDLKGEKIVQKSEIFNPLFCVVNGSICDNFDNITMNDLLGTNYFIEIPFLDPNLFTPKLSLVDFAIYKPILVLFYQNDKMFNQETLRWLNQTLKMNIAGLNDFTITVYKNSIEELFKNTKYMLNNNVYEVVNKKEENNKFITFIKKNDLSKTTKICSYTFKKYEKDATLPIGFFKGEEPIDFIFEFNKNKELSLCSDSLNINLGKKIL